MSDPSSPSKLPPLGGGISMLDEVSPQGHREEQGSEEGAQGGECRTSSYAGLNPDPLVLLIQVTQLDGKPFPVGVLTAHIVARQILYLTGKNPNKIEVITGQGAIVQMDPESFVVPVAQALHNLHVWDGNATEITCLMSSRKHVQEIAYECKTFHHQSHQVDQETHRVQQEQQQSRDQMVDQLWMFGKEVKKVEELRVQVEKPIEMLVKKETWGVRLVTEENNLTTRMTTSIGETKISKSPQICLFSGNKLVPRNESKFS